jgi:hypothetical protein
VGGLLLLNTELAAKDGHRQWQELALNASTRADAEQVRREREREERGVWRVWVSGAAV